MGRSDAPGSSVLMSLVIVVLSAFLGSLNAAWAQPSADTSAQPSADTSAQPSVDTSVFPVVSSEGLFSSPVSSEAFFCLMPSTVCATPKPTSFAVFAALAASNHFIAWLMK
eukprot:CAMPEP_0185791182 /NCGR_PEP_ID=MMETSP1174-20130828/158230_1 /TAXON_ID=35687 /ORGANISM="Dictyocha speculum, Strain CCMP1381" /LENGTH=110 /DNA_ID=CAMNT_0028486097 /DNA_START=322 /DNA_END=655 /DNA_ORIENTATION=-